MGVQIVVGKEFPSCDTLNGDYSSGAARMLEAIVTALAVAAGVGASMALFHQLTGGGTVW